MNWKNDMYEVSNPLVVLFNIESGHCDKKFIEDHTPKTKRNDDDTYNRVASRGIPLEDKMCALFWRFDKLDTNPIAYRTSSSTPVDCIIKKGDAIESKAGKGRVQYNSSSVYGKIDKDLLILKAKRSDEDWINNKKHLVYFREEAGSVWIVYGKIIACQEGVENVPEIKNITRKILSENIQKFEEKGWSTKVSHGSGDILNVESGKASVRIRAFTSTESFVSMFSIIFDKLFGSGTPRRACALIPSDIFFQYPREDIKKLCVLIRLGKIAFHWTNIDNIRTAAIMVK